MNQNKLKILAIETSCDDTCVAVWDGNECVVNLISSQDHNKFGGILPEYAARNHIKTLPILVKAALEEANLSLAEIDIIGVTSMPGLLGSLMVGTSYAKALAWAADKKIIGVHHIEAHLLIAHYDCKLSFPYGALVASGGHTLLAVVEGLGKYKLLGTSFDDAAGECFDKVAREMGLPQPGGPEIEKLAKTGKKSVPLSVPLQRDGSCNFSFSGLKTATIRCIHQGIYTMRDIAASFQATVAQTFAERLENAIKINPEVKTWVIVGGVAANQSIRHKLSQVLHNFGMNFEAPRPNLCTDNAMMVGYAAKLYAEQGIFSDLALEPKSSMRLDEWSKLNFSNQLKSVG